MLRLLAALVAVAAVGCTSGSHDGKAQLALPADARFKEATLTSTAFGPSGLIGPIGGPSMGYDLALELKPNGPTLLLLGDIGKDELRDNKTFNAISRARLALQAAPDGHALAYSYDDRVSWHGVWIDGRVPFVCYDQLVAPGRIPPTRDETLAVLTHAVHDGVTKHTPNRGALYGNDAPEMAGALSYALSHASDRELLDAALAWLTREPTPRWEHLALQLSSEDGDAAAARVLELAPDKLAAVKKELEGETSFWAGVDRTGRTPAPEAK